MSANKLINAVIALVEKRPADAREMLRSPEMKQISSSEVQQRLACAVLKRERAAQVMVLKQVLNDSLRIEVTQAVSADPAEAYLQGVAAVEKIIDDYIDAFDS